ncbi:MAG TPA: transcription termination/antitermination protein NusG [Urbifossiella sp.]|nr:transcription termination/antitermination protein NusG [Urbifossiella sp.]
MTDETTPDAPPPAPAPEAEPLAALPETTSEPTPEPITEPLAALPETPAELPAEEPAAEEPVAETVAEEEAEPEPEPEEEPAAVEAVAPAEEPSADAPPAEPESKKKWYVIKVQSGREETIKAAIERKVKIEGLEEFFGQVMIPYEEFVEKKSVRAKVKNKKTGEVETVTQEKNVVKKRKKFHGYIFAEVEFNDKILYLFRETSGVGDFVGGGGALKPPTPMPEIEVRKMMGTARPEDKKPIAVKLDYEKGDRVRVKDGAFSGSEAEVKAITMPKDPTDTPKVTVVVTIWGRPVEMEMDYWHVEKL